ncbi:hypothetical protein GHT06_019786 [Daphnia sinensis]|uniref:Uncharacterized protein n=1 Tax=Daphnia sinensis TaxID=1820382 RepID=A0AAD5L2H2_9CRUS|nr:hypothetical protein GHT06_019786 [Daphnia sinensis]
MRYLFGPEVKIAIVSDVASLVKRKPPHWSKLFNMSRIERKEEEKKAMLEIGITMSRPARCGFI